MKHKPRHITSEVKQVNKDGSVRFRLTSKKVDRHGEVVLPDGIILDNFKNNPIVLFGHGFRNNVPIGKIDPDSFKITKSYVDANIIFDEEGKDPFAEMIGDKVRNGFLNAGYIGFRPTVLAAEPVLPKQTGQTIQEWELFEFSVVPVPSNANALARREFVDECKTFMPDLTDEMFLTSVEKEMAEGYKTINKEAEDLIEKAGRVLSSKNRNLVKNVADQMRPLLKMLDTLYEATEPKLPDEGKDSDSFLPDLEEQNRVNDVLIKDTLQSIEVTKLINNINDIGRIVS